MSLADWLNARAEVSRLEIELSGIREALNVSEVKREVEQARHLKREDHLVAVITRQVKDYAPMPSSVGQPAQKPVDPGVMAARDEAALARFVEDALAVGKTEQDGKDSFDAFKFDGLTPFQRRMEQGN